MTASQHTASPDDAIASMANEVYLARQRLIHASQASMDVFDDRSAALLQEEYARAEAEYQHARATFVRALHAAGRPDSA